MSRPNEVIACGCSRAAAHISGSSTFRKALGKARAQYYAYSADKEPKPYFRVVLKRKAGKIGKNESLRTDREVAMSEALYSETSPPNRRQVAVRERLLAVGLLTGLLVPTGLWIYLLLWCLWQTATWFMQLA